MNGDEPFRTDEGNFILDLHLAGSATRGSSRW
jgi:ribose 5-phosphate isomerase